MMVGKYFLNKTTGGIWKCIAQKGCMVTLTAIKGGSTLKVPRQWMKHYVEVKAEEGAASND